MFAQHKLGAACLADYKDIKKGAIVPPVNELYAQVEEWLESNEWKTLPDDFGANPPSNSQLISQYEKYLSETDWVVIKINEQSLLGGDTSELLSKYSDVIAERQTKRDLINTLQAEQA